MDWNLGLVAIALLTVGLVGQAFEMRRIRRAEEEVQQYTSLENPANVFLNKRNFKWYAVIGLGILFWYIAERS